MTVSLLHGAEHYILPTCVTILSNLAVVEFSFPMWKIIQLCLADGLLMCWLDLFCYQWQYLEISIWIRSHIWRRQFSASEGYGNGCSRSSYKKYLLSAKRFLQDDEVLVWKWQDTAGKFFLSPSSKLITSTTGDQVGLWLGVSFS